MSAHDRIAINSKVMLGKPVIRGTRITVELILEKLAAGETREQILDSYPRLASEDISAALTYAAEAVRTEILHPIGAKAA